MRLDLTGDQELMRETVRRFLQSELPLVAIRKAYDSGSGFCREQWRAALELGWAMLGVPEALGGVSLSGRPAQDLAIVAEEMGRLVAPGPFQSTVIALMALAESRNAETFASLMSEVITGSSILSWAYGEPGNVWDSAQFKTRVELSAEGWYLSGTKAYVEAGAEAQHLVVTAKYAEQSMQFLVPVSSPGVSVVPCRSLDFVRRFSIVQFDNVKLDEAAHLNFHPGSGSIARQSQLALLLQCAETNGAVERAMEFTMDYMRQRYAFGRSIASYQALKHRLADMLLSVHSCMSIVDAAIDAFDKGTDDAEMLASICKSYVGTKSSEIMSDLVQMTGGIAVTWEHDLHLYSRRIALNRALFGTPEHFRNRLQSMLAA